MDLVSLLITILGIMILLGLYVMGRVFDQTPAQQSSKSIRIPTYTDSNGIKLSSIKADIPSRTVTNHSNFTAHTDYSSQVQQSSTATSSLVATNNAAPSTDTIPTLPDQFVLFIASLSEQPLDGNQIITAMSKHGLKLGEKDIYHYTISENNTNNSLFSVANGVSPWTLRKEDLLNQSTPGLSLIMPLPTAIDTGEAIHVFIHICDKLAKSINGELQNTQQQIFLPTDQEVMLESVGL